VCGNRQTALSDTQTMPVRALAIAEVEAGPYKRYDCEGLLIP
jgi:hypothetical protein